MAGFHPIFISSSNPCPTLAIPKPELDKDGQIEAHRLKCLVCRGEPDAEYQEKLKQAMADKAEDLVSKFQEDWTETMQNMAEAEDAFEDLEGEQPLSSDLPGSGFRAHAAARHALVATCLTWLQTSRGSACWPGHGLVRVACFHLLPEPHCRRPAETGHDCVAGGADLMDSGTKGFDSHEGMWRNSGWQVASLLSCILACILACIMPQTLARLPLGCAQPLGLHRNLEPAACCAACQGRAHVLTRCTLWAGAGEAAQEAGADEGAAGPGPLPGPLWRQGAQAHGSPAGGCPALPLLSTCAALTGCFGWVQPCMLGCGLLMRGRSVEVVASLQSLWYARTVGVQPTWGMVFQLRLEHHAAATSHACCCRWMPGQPQCTRTMTGWHATPGPVWLSFGRAACTHHGPQAGRHAMALDIPRLGRHTSVFSPVTTHWHPSAGSVQVHSPRGPPGVIKSELQPEETSGLARSGDISRMLPMEAHLLAQGWAARAAMSAAGAGSKLWACRSRSEGVSAMLEGGAVPLLGLLLRCQESWGGVGALCLSCSLCCVHC